MKFVFFNPYFVMALLVLAVVPLLLACVYILRSRRHGSPPVASFGVMLQLAAPVFQGRLSEIHSCFHWIRDRYGSIVASPISIIKPWIFISDYKLVKETFKSSACFGRPGKGFKFLYFSGKEPRGIALQENEGHWSEIRGFTFKKLKEYGTGRYALDSILREEADDLIAKISENYINKPIYPEDLLNMPNLNVMWRVISGERFDLQEVEALKMVNIISNFFSASDFKTVCFISLVWFLGDISTALVFWVPRLKALQAIRQFLLKYADSSKAAFNGEINTFTDAFIQKIRETTNPSSMFYGRVGGAENFDTISTLQEKENLAATVGELLSVGSKTSSVTLWWILLYLAAHPEKQETLQKQVDSVLEGRAPTIDDKTLMPYVVAVMNETMRIRPLLPIGLPHRAMEDVQVGSYKIRKGSAVFSNASEILSDPHIWGDPEIFRPERFLSPDGRTIVPHPAFIPFGVGKRACPGKQLAEHNMFIFVVSIFQKFSVAVPSGAGRLSLSPKMFTFTLEPSQELVFSPR